MNSYTTEAPIPATVLTNHSLRTAIERRDLNSSTTIGWLQFGTINWRINLLLEEYATLQGNWDGDDALAPSPKVLVEVKSIISLLSKQGQAIFHAAPGTNGEIMLDLRNSVKGKSVEIIIYSSHAVAVYFSNNEKPKQIEFNLTKLREILKWLNS